MCETSICIKLGKKLGAKNVQKVAAQYGILYTA